MGSKRHDRPTEQRQEQGEGRGPGRGRKLCLWTAKGRGGARAADPGDVGGFWFLEKGCGEGKDHQAKGLNGPT